jgi:prepilin-type N-terminal cleavage/methylation domain-containing protein
MCRRRCRHRQHAFTLIELLVVIGILALLVGILLPAVMKAYGRATNARLALDLSAIGTALEAYRQDHGDYPRVRTGYYNSGGTTTALGNSPDRPNPPTGAQILCWALIAPAPASEPSPPGNERAKQDGADGPGFRVRPQGKVFAYLNPEQFKFGVPNTEPLDLSPANVMRFTILDRNDQPILYFPAATSKPDYREAGSNEFVTGSDQSLYDVRDNQLVFSPMANIAERKMRLLLGDVNMDGVIQSSETPKQGKYLLWSAGADDVFGARGDEASPATMGPEDAPKCDDVIHAGQ